MQGPAGVAGGGGAVQHSQLMICLSLLPIASTYIPIAIYICIYNVVFRPTTFYMYLPPICGNRRIFQQKHLPSFQKENNVDRDLQDVRSILLEVEQLSGEFASIQNGIIYVTFESIHTMSVASTYTSYDEHILWISLWLLHLLTVTSDDCRI